MKGKKIFFDLFVVRMGHHCWRPKSQQAGHALGEQAVSLPVQALQDPLRG